MFIIPQPAKMSRRAFFNCLIPLLPGSFPAGLCRPPRRPGGHPPAVPLIMCGERISEELVPVLKALGTEFVTVVE